MLTGEVQVKIKYIPVGMFFFFFVFFCQTICDVLPAERPQDATNIFSLHSARKQCAKGLFSQLYLIIRTILPNMLAMSDVCIEDESHKRLPKDLPTLVDGSHRGQSTNVVRLGDLNHFQVHPGSDFTCAPYFRSLPQSQSRAQSLSEGA